MSSLLWSNAPNLPSSSSDKTVCSFCCHITISGIDLSISRLHTTIDSTHFAYHGEMTRLSWPGWLGWTPRRYTPRTATHLSINPARRRVTSLICPTTLPLSQTANHRSSITVNGTPSQSYGTSLAICNHTSQPTQANAPRLSPSHAGWYSIYLLRRVGRLSSPSWLDSAPAASRTSDHESGAEPLHHQDNR